MADKMDHDHEEHEHEKDAFEPLKAEYYEGKHLSAPVKEIQVRLLAHRCQPVQADSCLSDIGQMEATARLFKSQGSRQAAH